MSAYKNIFSTILLAAPLLAADPVPQTARRQAVAPPKTPPRVHSDATEPEPRLVAAATTYSIGDPTPEEQLYIEMINRARANPTAEGVLFANATDPAVVLAYNSFGVNLALMQADLALIPFTQPLAPNAQLAAAARRHSADMLAKSFQEHIGSDNSTPVQRITDAGYQYSTIGENVYANAETVFHGHAGFDVDWGPGVGGMQSPPGHRNTIHDPIFREIGVGVVFGRNVPAPGSQGPQYHEVGPQLVSQDFGTRRNSTPLITGVAYFDLNGNNFYDPGEGVGGVRVAVSGTATEGVTARSGGYAVPVAGNGTYTVTFSGPGFTAFSREITVAQNANQKVDFLPAYLPPSVTGSATPAVNNPNPYQISAVAAATAYQWRSYQLAPAAVEGAENSTNRVTIQNIGDYEVFETATKHSGSYSFHLAHPAGGNFAESVSLNPGYSINANSELRFRSRLGWATDQEFATVQVSTNNGRSWSEIYRQAGTATRGELSFQERTLSLAQFAGSTLQVRFVFVPGSSFYPDTDSETGWFIDDITLQGASEISNEQIAEAANANFSFQPATLGDYVLQARARTGHDFLPWGPGLAVRSLEGTATPAELRVSGIRVINGQVELDVDLLAGSVAAGLTLQIKSALIAPRWTTATASVQTLSTTRFRLTAPMAVGVSAFYRIQAN